MSPITGVAGAILAIAFFLALFGGLLVDEPKQIDLVAGTLGPSADHPLGTDQLGRDILARVLTGARTAVLGPLAIAVFATVIATIVGLAAGYLGGFVDTVISRACDIVYALPGLLVAIIVVGVVGGGYFFAIAILIVLNLPWAMRNLRAATLEQRGLAYVESARLLGLGRVRIMIAHLLPNIAPMALSVFFLAFTYAFVELSTLSFLGLGVDPGTPDWGRMIAESRVLFFENPWAALAPLIMLVATTVSANLVGDDLEGRMRSRGRAR